MKQVILIGTVATLLVLLAASCAPKPEPSLPAPAATTSPEQSLAGKGKAGWEAQWEKTMSAAKKEGELLLYMYAEPAARIPIVEAFDKKFGIRLNTLTAPSPDLLTRIQSEYRAGVYQVDVYIGGLSGLMVQTKPMGYLSLLEPALILPEVKDPGMWLGGKLPFFDRDGTALGWLANSSAGIIYNTSLVKKGEIASYLDLRKPEWKEKIVMSDPTAGAGTARDHMYILVEEWGLDKAKEYLSYVVQQQKAVVTRNQYQSVEWVARGKAAIGLFPSNASLRQFVKGGAPLATPVTKEAKQMSASNGGLAIPARPAHPNATIVFVNWLLSREGQTVAAEAFGGPSARIDVPAAESVPEIARPQPGQKYVFTSEESSKKGDEFVIEWKKIIGQ